MLILLALSLCLSAVMMAVSLAEPTDGRTDWPLSVLAHIFWPVSLALVYMTARRSRFRTPNGS